MRILLAEDDRQLANALARRLAEAGHAVDVFPSVAEAGVAWTLAVYDLAIIDVMLGGRRRSHTGQDDPSRRADDADAHVDRA